MASDFDRATLGVILKLILNRLDRIEAAKENDERDLERKFDEVT